MKMIVSLLLSVFILGTLPVYAAENEKTLEEQLQEWEEAGIDPNHTEVIENIRNYINENVEPGAFSSLHIDREEKQVGIIVLSFTEEITPQVKQDIEALVSEPAEVAFRVVEFTEEELMAKQNEVDAAVFEKKVLEPKGITVTHTSTDIIHNQVEIGISPFNEENSEMVYEHFGKDMLRVVEGEHAQPLMEEASTDDKKGIFAKIFEFFANLFNN